MLAIFAVLGLIFSDQSELYNEVYKDINSASFCVQFMNATHKFGCTSYSSGTTGRIYEVANQDNLNKLLAGNIVNAIALLHPLYSDGNTLKSLKNSGNCHGAIIINTNPADISPNRRFSPDLSCPSSRHDFYGEKCHPWNSNYSTGQYYYDFSDFPIAAVNSKTDISAIKACITRHGEYCSARMESFMMAAGNTLRCRFRSNTPNYFEYDTFCLPLGGHNLHLPFFLPASPRKIDHVVWVVSKLDGMSEFPTLSPVADSVLTGLIATIAVIEKFTSLRNLAPNQALFFSFFAGESFDYIGSSRAVLDLEKGKWNETILKDFHVPIQSIDEMYEISQIISPDGTLHVHQNSFAPSNVNKQIFDDLNSTAAALNILVRPSSGELPPSPIQSFMKKKASLPSAILTGFDQRFKSNMYNSIFDQYHTLNCTDCIDQIVRAANLTLNFLYKRLTKSNPPADLGVDKNTITQLFDCLMKNVNCSLIRSVLTDEVDLSSVLQSLHGNNILPFVIGPYSDDMSMYSFITKRLLSFYGGVSVALTKENCKRNSSDSRDFYDYSWINDSQGGHCYKSPLFASTAVSPAFENLDAAQFSDDLIEGYSSWTISNYDEPKLSIFVASPVLYQGMFLLGGLVVVMLSSLPFVLYHHCDAFNYYINTFLGE